MSIKYCISLVVHVPYIYLYNTCVGTSNFQNFNLEQFDNYLFNNKGQEYTISIFFSFVYPSQVEQLVPWLGGWLEVK